MPVRPHPRARRPVGALAAALLASALTGCGGDDPVVLDEEPVAAQPTEAPAVSDEQQLRDLVEAYDAALDEVQERGGDAAAFEGVLTADLAAEYSRNYTDNIYGNGMQMLGSWSFEVGDVEVDGDSATIEVCTDGTDVYVVPAGEGIGDGARNQGIAPQVLTAEQVDDGWLLAGAAAGGEACA
ncbi:hypothetical protein [Nocardioides perillae]|uniref:Putative small lipoprotein YifL n=1 Tax=Nocardioides perillae TaxID=1119534 RepID=A0A7Y9RRQ7_9ACTN|nr:hypothetical protein [Nocardioides perillae]NYG55120.1 putative small lipoprotein YifL [Nocardioides perillae]